MGQIIAIVNQKGGVGKTTTAVNLAYALHAAGKRVLLCDLDPQANATSGFGAEKGDEKSSYQLLIDPESARTCITITEYGDLIRSGAGLSGAGIELVGMENRERCLKTALDLLRDSYDYIFIDCPPSLEMLTLNALVAADSILVPVQCEYYALEGLSDLMRTLRNVKAAFNPDLGLFGVVLTMYDGRTNLSVQVAEEVRRHFPAQVFATVIPRNIRLSEAPSHGLPVQIYDRSSRGAKSYTDLAQEILRRERKE